MMQYIYLVFFFLFFITIIFQCLWNIGFKIKKNNLDCIKIKYHDTAWEIKRFLLRNAGNAHKFTNKVPAYPIKFPLLIQFLLCWSLFSFFVSRSLVLKNYIKLVKLTTEQNNYWQKVEILVNFYSIFSSLIFSGWVLISPFMQTIDIVAYCWSHFADISS